MTPPRDKPHADKLTHTVDGGPFPVDPALSREDFLRLSRDYLSVFKKSLVELRSSGSGRAFVRDYSRIVDSIVATLYQRAAHDYNVRTRDLDIAIIAMGGYGRAELAPYSDVDILVLCKRKTPIVNQVASSFVRLMWDAGFELGHTVESLIESESTLARHMDTRTALFESRWICGSKTVAREAEKQIQRLRKKDREAFLVRKVTDAVRRHKTQSRSYQLIEPNVKLSAGGMRDFQTLVWLGMLGKGEVGLAALRKRGLLLRGEAAALEDAYEFLTRVRVELHVVTESKQDQLNVAMQKVVAERLGYRDRRGHLAVELFMRDYYNHTRTIHSIVEDVIDELDQGKNVSMLLGRKTAPSTRGKLTMSLNRKTLRARPLYVFEKQKQTGLKLTRGLKRRLGALLETDLGDRKGRQQMRAAFPKLIKDGNNLTLVLRSMHETGFLAAVIPEYGELTSLKRYDLYHHYTVDEHSFQVVHNIEALASTKRRAVAPLARIYSEIANKQILFLAALLHDIGKIEGKGHAKKGAVLATKILRRMGLSAESTSAIAYLIEIHLLMSHFSQRRDPSDPETLDSFTKTVRTRTNLKYLCLLTYADLKATSPIVWTEWKRALLWTLYINAYRYMATTEKEPEAVYKARKRTILRAFPKGAAKLRAREHLDMLPGRYLLTMTPAQVKRHIDAAAALDARMSVVDLRHGRLGAEITFCTHDKPYRLAHLCGVLTLNDCNILFAYAFTRTDGKVLDVFHVADLSGTAPIDDKRIRSIREDLDSVLGGTMEIHDEVDQHARKWRRRKGLQIPVAAGVEFENDLSEDVTIVDIFAADRPGLLFKLTWALAEAGLRIHRARISTEANRAIDSFDVQDKRGRKVTSAGKLKEVRMLLEAALD